MIAPIGPPSLATLPDIGLRNATETGFGSMLQAAVHRVETAHSQATAKIEQFLSGDSEDLHTTALAVQKSELELEMFLQFRNKVTQAYQEIMRTQV